MDQRQSQSTQEGESRSWAQENHPSRANETVDFSTAYGDGGQHEHPPPTGQQATFQAWYENRGGAVHTQLNPGSGHHLPWSAYGSPAHGEYYNQETQVTYHLPRHASQPPPHEQAYLIRTPWSNRIADSEQAYSNVQYLPPQSSSQSEQYSTAPSTPAPSLGQPLPQPARGRRRDRAAVLSRSPSLTFGPYTSTILQPPRDASAAETSRTEFVASHAVHTPYGELDIRGPMQIIPATEPSTRAAENSQFVVPSSRIPRVEGSPHAAVTSQASTPRTSHSPEVSTETKPKRRRANATQLRLLNETYARTMFPTTEERAEIARRINMTPRQVQIWFQNRRQASRQTQVPDSPISLGSHDPGLPQHGTSSHSSVTSEYREGSSSYSTGSGADAGFPYDAEREDS